jgi:arylformamidase
VTAAWRDVTLPIGPDSIAWAGLAAPRLVPLAALAAGDAVNVAALDCCLHTGTHADAPFHVQAGGRTAERLDVSAYVGPALVVRTADPDRIERAELEALGVGRPGVERLLLATPAQYDGRSFPAAIPCLTPETAEWLVGLGLRLVGVNVPSLDPLDSRAMTVHRILFEAGLGVLENLALDGVAPGTYELVAPPLAVVGGDAAPVRALLRPLG